MNSIAEIFDDSKHFITKGIISFVDKYIGCSLLRKCGITKIVDEISTGHEAVYHDNPILRLIGQPETSTVLKKVVKAKDLLIDKILLCFYQPSAYQMFKTGTFFRDYKKDTFYRFDLMPTANWERLQLETARNVIRDVESRTSKNHVNALVFDDSLYTRRGGKGTELCARVYDHCDHKMRLGYRMMTGGWTNGKMFVPFAQVLLSTRDSKNMVGPDEKEDMRSLCGKRRAAAKEKGTAIVQKKVDAAREAGIPFDYVLFDTWFSNPAQLIPLKNGGANVIAMIKKGRTKYTWQDPNTGEEFKLNVKEIYGRNKKRRGLSKYLLSVNVSVSDQDGNSIPAKLVYARNRNNRKDWVCFICTDMDADEEKVLRIYTFRWQVETYFKIVKGYLKLRTECHSTSYDAITSHMVIVALRYMMLAIERFNNTDNRSIVDIFYNVQREVINEMMDCAIVIILDVMLQSVRNFFSATEDQIDRLIADFINNLPAKWKNRFQLPACS